VRRDVEARKCVNHRRPQLSPGARYEDAADGTRTGGW
jgi:hypothetical protein